MKKIFKRVLSAVVTASMLFSSAAFNTVAVSAAPSVSAGWNECLYAEWIDSDPDSDSVKVGYKLSTDSEYTYLEGNDHEFLIRPASTSGYGRVDIPALKAGRYDIEITASDGTVHTRSGIKVYAYDRSGYAHFNNTEGVGAYNDDGTLKDNAIVVYVTDENKDTVEVPGYEGHADISYASSSSGATWTRGTAGVGNILNNNHKFVYEIVGTDAHPLVFRFIGTVNPPENLTPYNTKTNELGGSKGDNGNLAITKYGKNITLEGIGDDAVIDGWGFTFSQTSTCPTDAGKNFEVRNLTFKNYPEDGLGFQGDDGIDCPIQRVWVHNNVFYPGYCANPAESDKAEGDGSCDFKRGQYYTMSYNTYINCHKTNLVGSGTSDDQYYMTLHHNWYQSVGSRQPLAANGNIHIYSTYFQGATSTTVDTRGKNCVLLEENYYDTCKNYFKSRNNTCIAKSYNEIINGGSIGSEKGVRTVVSSKSDEALTGSTYTFPDGTSIDNFDLNSTYFYKDNYEITAAADVPEYVTTYAGTLKAFPETESGDITITVKDEKGAVVTDASVTANGLNFLNNGDGTYSATASLGAEYVITISKEGYSNETVTSTVINEDGGTFDASVSLAVDYDGYAVVSLVGGTSNTPVKGATVTLADGTVLADQGDGTYKSANQIAVGTYSATVTNTGDYIAPTEAQTITVKTTDAATEIHLDISQGTVSVTLTAAADETTSFDPTGASVYVGTTQLTDNGDGTYTGEVDINTALDVSVNKSGWKVDSITPSKLTATKDGTAEAVVIMYAMGDTYTWNYTDGTNTDNFFEVEKNGGEPSKWSSASSNPQTYGDYTLTAAIKLESSTTVMFDAPSDGELVLVLYQGKTGCTIKVNGAAYDVTDGVNTIPITQGSVTLTKGSGELHIYLMQYIAGENAGDDDDDDNSDSSTESTTEAPTESTTEAPTESTTEAPTESTTEAMTLYDEIMWNVEEDMAPEGSDGLTLGETFYSNSEEDGPVEFSDGTNTYELEYWLQGKNNPTASDGYNPANTGSIPVAGAYAKFSPTADGAFTVAAKTNGGKITYVTDETGKQIAVIGSADSATSYDVFSFNVEAGKDYYIYSGGSKICLYYLGYTAGKTVVNRFEPDVTTDYIYGDADNDGILTANDAAYILQKVLDDDYSMVIESAYPNDYMSVVDVDGDGLLLANDAAIVLQKVLDDDYSMPVES